MNRFRILALAAAAVTITQTACARQTGPAGVKVLSQKELRKVVPTVARPASAADITFFQGMIPHHAQAVLISSWAATHGARLDVRTLCERIVVGQGDEIALMQQWLRSKGAEVPAADATHMKMKMNGMDHDMLMPGMLSEAELKELDAARGTDFDRLFLKAMIKHHQGAVSMVNDLLSSPNAANDDVIYKAASDVYADQTTEIERMTKMLATVPASGKAP